MKCYNHPHKDAIAQCSDCGKGLCEECATKWKPPTCDDCMKNYVNNELSSVNSELMFYVILSIVGGVAGGLLALQGKHVSLSTNIFGIFYLAICFPIYVAGWKWLNKITDYFIFLGTIKFWLIYIFIKLCFSAIVGIFALPYRLFSIFKRRNELNKLLEDIDK